MVGVAAMAIVLGLCACLNDYEAFRFEEESGDDLPQADAGAPLQ
jgi:hypothetical protein